MSRTKKFRKHPLIKNRSSKRRNSRRTKHARRSRRTKSKFLGGGKIADKIVKNTENKAQNAIIKAKKTARNAIIKAKNKAKIAVIETEETVDRDADRVNAKATGAIKKARARANKAMRRLQI